MVTVIILQPVLKMGQEFLLFLSDDSILNNNNNNNNKDFYSAISVGSWHFTTEYFEKKILKIKKITSIIEHKYIEILI